MEGLFVSNVHKSFSSDKILRGVELKVTNGNLTSILGASGSGKTTLLRIMAGFEPADEGTVSWDGVVFESRTAYLPAERRRIGYVSQDGALFPHLSVWNNVAFGVPRNERKGRRIDELLDLVGLRGLGKRFPHQLSGGEQQRVALARALGPKPRLILLDEPFSALDASLRVSLRKDVRKILSETGQTTVLVTHDQEEALSLSDHVAVLRDGRIVQSGVPRQIYETPVDPQLALFLGDANILEGILDRGHVRTLFGRSPLAHDFSQGIGCPVNVLVRPEQIEVFPYANDTGLAARIEQCDYFGHDAVLTAYPLDSSGLKELILRVPGTSVPIAGTKVRLVQRGVVHAWPR